MRTNRSRTGSCTLSILAGIFFSALIAWPPTVRAWSDLGIYGGQITSVVTDPRDPDRLFAGSWGGDGLFTSTNGGASWQAVGSGKRPWFRNLNVFDIALDVHNQGAIWVANNDYIDVSHDDGQTWESLDFASREGRFCYSVAVDPHDPTGNTVFVGTGGPNYATGPGTVFLTDDGGRTWSQTGLNALFSIYDIKIHPYVPGEIWAVANTYQIAPFSQIWVSHNGGASWTSWFLDHYTDEIALVDHDPYFVFAAGTTGIMRSTDRAGQAASWQQLAPPGPCSALCVPSGPPFTLHASLMDTFVSTTDFGKTWSCAPSPGEFLSLAADTTDPARLYAGHVNRGLYISSDSGKTWQQSLQGIRANAVFSSAVSPSSPPRFVCGTFAGVYEGSAQQGWDLINAAPSEAVALHPRDPDILYAGFDWKFGRSTNQGRDWQYYYLEDQENANCITTIALSDQVPETVFAGVSFYDGTRGQVIKSVNGGGSFRTVFEADAPVNCIVVYPQSPDTVFAGTGDFYNPRRSGALYKSTDAGTSWRKVSLGNRVVTCLAVSPASPQRLYAGCGTYSYSHAGIFASTDCGETWAPFQDGLPDSYCVTAIDVDRTNRGTVFAALYDQGVFQSLDNGGYWTKAGLDDYLVYDVTSLSPDPAAGGYTARQGTATPACGRNIIAGTASGAYALSTSETGMITGTIRAAGTAVPIDRAVITSSCGGSCLSAEGYYLLIVPAGRHELSAQAEGYDAASLWNVPVDAGQTVTCDITLQPSTDTGQCIAARLLRNAGHSGLISKLRLVRDGILAGTDAGRHIISLYYSNRHCLEYILDNNPELQKEATDLLIKTMDLINKPGGCIQNAAVRVLLSAALRYLDRLQAASGDCLERSIVDIRNLLNLNTMHLLLRPGP